jgi:3-hydroxyisobutyrate dehydrogenase
VVPRPIVVSGHAARRLNRTAAKCEELRAAGARVAASPAELFARTETVILMLAGEEAVDQVPARATPDFGPRVAGRTIVPMGTISPAQRGEALAGRGGGVWP